MRSLAASLLLTLVVSIGAVPQQSSTPPAPDPAKAKKNKNEAAAPSKTPEPAAQPQSTSAPPPPPERKPEAGKETPGEKEEHYDMTEVPPAVTHHQITVDGKV